MALAHTLRPCQHERRAAHQPGAHACPRSGPRPAAPLPAPAPQTHSGVDVYTAMSGAVGALYGPLHGGANEAVLRMLARIGSVDKIPAFIEGARPAQRTVLLM